MQPTRNGALASPRWLARLLRTPVAPITPTLVIPPPVKYRLYFGGPLRFDGPPTPEHIGRSVGLVHGALEKLIGRGLAERRRVFS